MFRAAMTAKRLGLSAACAILISLGPDAPANETRTVELYGVIDLSFYANTVSRSSTEIGGAVKGSQVGLTSGVLSGSRWGLRGSERLGDGWRAQFVLESGINAQEGTLGQGGLPFGRQATVGVQHPEFGTIDLGRKGSFSYEYMVPFDPFALSGSQAGAGTSFGSANGLRLNNFMAYESPWYAGWQAAIGYSLNTGLTAIYANSSSLNVQPGSTTFGNSDNMRALSAAVRHHQGPLELLLTLDVLYGANRAINNQGAQIPTNVTANPMAWILAASYDLKVVKLSGAIGQTIHGLFLGQSAGAGGYETPLQTASSDANVIFSAGVRATSYLASATIPVRGSDQILLSLQGMIPRGNLERNRQLSTQTIISAAYVHRFSKRTDVYVWGSYGHNFQSYLTAMSSVVGVGMRHLF